MIIGGLDLAAKSGVVVLDGDKVLVNLMVQVKGIDDRFKRWEKYSSIISSLVAGCELVVIEGYAFAFKNAGIPLVEQGAIIKLALWHQAIPFIEVPPSTLKVFVTGSAKSKKKEMGIATQSRWGFTNSDDNIVDAFGLAKLGQVMKTQKTPPELMGLREKYGFL